MSLSLRSERRKSITAHVLRLRIGNQHIILNTNATIGAQFFYGRPVNQRCVGASTPAVQQRIYKIETRLNRDHIARLQHPCQPEKRMSVWARDLSAVRIRQQTGHVMGLEPEEMP